MSTISIYISFLLSYNLVKRIMHISSIFKDNFRYLLVFILMGFSIHGLTQEKKPKVALVLSGGGAKGLAHIPLLQTLDSLGIVPDLVVGNSMGSIVGGLYSMGYSGDSIAAISKTIKWDQLIGGKVSLRNVSVEEKSEFNQYLVELSWGKGKVQIGQSLLNDQNLRQFISDISFPSYQIDDFDKLQIPYRAIATDIVNGRELILKDGDLSFAMRASMSIPGAFSPVPYKETLLVDGGLLNNFPVDVAKEMGADIIIGSDVGDGMQGKDELENISTLLFQAAMLSSNLKNPKNRELCDILLDHTPHLSGSTADFQKSKQIYIDGKVAVSENIDALVELAERLKNYEQRKIKLPDVSETFVLDTIIYKNISSTNRALVEARTNIRTHEEYSRQEIIDGINRAMGTTIFDQIVFGPTFENGKLGIELTGYERSKHQIKGALHYDDFHGVGILANYTGRNILGAASRSMITLDIAEQPRMKIQHQKNFGGDRNWWWQSQFMGQRLNQKIFISGEEVDDVRYRYFDIDNQVNRNLNSMKNYVGFGVKYQNSKLKPRVDPDFNDNVYGLRKYRYESVQLSAHYYYNTLDEAQYATQGAFFTANASRSFYNKIFVQYTSPENPTQDGSTSQFFKLGANYEKRVRLSSATTGIFGISGNYTFMDDNKPNHISFSDYAIGAKYLLGGNQINPISDSFIFPGLNESELMVTQFSKINVGLQYNISPKIYIIPHADFATVGFKDFSNYLSNILNTKGRWADADTPSFIFSSGLNVGYKSILGPVNFDLSWVNAVEKTRVYFGVGFHFHR